MKVFFYIFGAFGVTTACMLMVLRFSGCQDPIVIFAMGLESFGLGMLALMLPWWGPRPR